VGTGASGFSGDGSEATSAALNNPYGVALDLSGIIYLHFLHFLMVTVFRREYLHR
jgi:hypothetical protein